MESDGDHEDGAHVAQTYTNAQENKYAQTKREDRDKLAQMFCVSQQTRPQMTRSFLLTKPKTTNTWQANIRGHIRPRPGCRPSLLPFPLPTHRRFIIRIIYSNAELSHMRLLARKSARQCVRAAGLPMWMRKQTKTFSRHRYSLLRGGIWIKMMNTSILKACVYQIRTWVLDIPLESIFIIKEQHVT